MPELVQNCIASWHKYMPDWEYRLWNEDNFPISDSPQYVREAYAAKKYAFVSDYVRLWALNEWGGLYMDVDFEVFKPFDDLMISNAAFAGYEGSKHSPVMMGVIASIPHSEWITSMLESYKTRNFVKSGDSYDMTPNTAYFTQMMCANGFVADGKEKFFHEVHIFPVYFFCPIQTTGEDLRNQDTYCEHKGLHSWSERTGVISRILSAFPVSFRSRLIKLKRKLFG